MSAPTDAVAEKVIVQALRSSYPQRFSPQTRLKLLPEQGWFNQTYLLEDREQKPLILRTRKATPLQQHQHTLGVHWSPYFKEAWAIQTAHMGVPVAGIDCNDIGYFYLPATDTDSSPVLVAYLLQEYLPYDTAASLIEESKRFDFFEHIGTVARQVNATPVDGFGDAFDHVTGSFTCSSWAAYIATEIEEFRSHQKDFRELLSDEKFESACARIADTGTLCTSATLYHLDFVKNWNNILVDEYESITGIIDWEFAGAGPATHCELASTLYIFYRDNASTFERRKEFNALLTGYGISLRAYAAYFRFDVESLVLRHCLNGLCKYVRLIESKNLDSQPWRKVHAARAVQLIEKILSRKRPLVYVSNPIVSPNYLAA